MKLLQVKAGLIFLALCCFQVEIIYAKGGGAATKITKCQDKDGKWHYGNDVRYLCDDTSDITKIDETGVKRGQVEGVKTAEELEIERQAKAEQEKKAEQEEHERNERQRIQTVYQSEEDVERAKNKEIDAIRHKIQQHENYVIALGKHIAMLERKKAGTSNKGIIRKTDAQISELDEKSVTSEKRILELNEQLAEAEKKYDEDLAAFRKYKNIE